MYYKIKEIAGISGVSVRMLRYYDRIGLLKPENVSRAGYRLYTEDDIKKLSQILFYRELDFSLGEIKEILSSSNSYKLEVLRMQQQILAKKRDKIDALMSAINKSIISLEQGENPGDADIFTSLDMAVISRNREQLKKDLMTHLFTHSDEKCGAKTSNYSKDDWTIVMSKLDAILNKIAGKMSEGPAGAEVQRLIGEYREFIDKNLTECSGSTLKILGKLYVGNPLYRNHMERYGGAFPEFLKKAMDIYAGDDEDA